MRILATTFPLLALATALTAPSAPSAYAGGGCHVTGLSDGPATEVSLTQNCFEPGVARVQIGDTVTWISHDTTAHTVTGSRNTFGGYGELFQNDTYSKAFDSEGVFPYFCQLHPGMVGAIVVGDGEPVTVTEPEADDGASGAVSVAAIAAAVGLGGAALGPVGTRLIGARKRDGER